MCGILGISTTRGRELRLSDERLTTLRDLMSHRGPDDAGIWRSPTAALAHRRLAVLDTSPAGRQPMVTEDGRFVLVYNGELYNDPELRSRLADAGSPVRSGCDAETVLRWLALRGPDGLLEMRGMFALGLLDTAEHRLLLARDPLGIKPLYWWSGREGGGPLHIFASEVAPILEHDAVDVRPDPRGVSAYLTTIRTTLGERTLFENVRSVTPGTAMLFDLSGHEMSWSQAAIPIASPDLPTARDALIEIVRDAMIDSVNAHLRADVPTCCLLSGGLDSAIISTVASAAHDHLRTYCAGAPDEAAIDGVPQSEDFSFAAAVARAIGSDHDEAQVSETMFAARWREMVARQGVPLSTPNEVAINEVARRLAADGNVVTLSGEGADELFGGYDHPLNAAVAHIDQGNPHPGLFQLALASWCPMNMKNSLLTGDAWDSCDHDAWLQSWFVEEFESGSTGTDALADHLAFQRRLNLTGLLGRLDSATMLASVEGRTPFADAWVAGLADALPMACKFEPPSRTKIALREAFADMLPGDVVARPKASFPIPFQRWVSNASEWLAASPLLREWFRPDAIAVVAGNPRAHWRLAWPMANLALWGERWWPSGASQSPTLISAGGPSPHESIQ